MLDAIDNAVKEMPIPEEIDDWELKEPMVWTKRSKLE